MKILKCKATQEISLDDRSLFFERTKATGSKHQKYCHTMKHFHWYKTMGRPYWLENYDISEFLYVSQLSSVVLEYVTSFSNYVM